MLTRSCSIVSRKRVVYKRQVEHSLVVLGNRCLADGIGYAHLVGRDVHNLIGETVDTDEMRTQLTRCV